MPIFQNWCGKGKASGYFILDENFAESGQLDLFYNDTNSQGSSALRQALTALLQNLRLTLSGVSPEQFAFLTAPVQMNQIPLKEELEPQTMHLVVSSVFTILVFFLDLYVGHNAHAERNPGKEGPHGGSGAVVHPPR